MMDEDAGLTAAARAALVRATARGGWAGALATLMLEHNISATALARRMSDGRITVSVSQISQYLRGQARPNRRTWQNISAALGVHVDELNRRAGGWPEEHPLVTDADTDGAEFEAAVSQPASPPPPPPPVKKKQAAAGAGDFIMRREPDGRWRVEISGAWRMDFADAERLIGMLDSAEPA